MKKAKINVIKGKNINKEKSNIKERDNIKERNNPKERDNIKERNNPKERDNIKERNNPKERNNIKEKNSEKIPLIGFTGFINVFLLICGALTVIFSGIKQFNQAAMFLAVGLLFYFARSKLEKIYIQETILNLGQISKYLSLCIAPTLLIFLKIIDRNPQSVLIFIPTMIAIVGSAINISREKPKISLTIYSGLLLLIYILLSTQLINETFASIILFVLGIILFF